VESSSPLACARKPFQCDRCRKRFPERDWLTEHKVWHIEVDLDRFDLYVYPCFYYCNYFASAADVRAHILADHINNHPLKITTKKEKYRLITTMAETEMYLLLFLFVNSSARHHPVCTICIRTQTRIALRQTQMKENQRKSFKIDSGNVRSRSDLLANTRRRSAVVAYQRACKENEDQTINTYAFADFRQVIRDLAHRKRRASDRR
jgi:hypothetical protein